MREEGTARRKARFDPALVELELLTPRPALHHDGRHAVGWRELGSTLSALALVCLSRTKAASVAGTLEIRKLISLHILYVISTASQANHWFRDPQGFWVEGLGIGV